MVDAGDKPIKVVVDDRPSVQPLDSVVTTGPSCPSGRQLTMHLPGGRILIPQGSNDAPRLLELEQDFNCLVVLLCRVKLILFAQRRRCSWDGLTGLRALVHFLVLHVGDVGRVVDPHGVHRRLLVGVPFVDWATLALSESDPFRHRHRSRWVLRLTRGGEGFDHSLALAHHAIRDEDEAPFGRVGRFRLAPGG